MKMDEELHMTHIETSGHNTVAVGAFGHVHCWGLTDLRLPAEEQDAQLKVQYPLGYASREPFALDTPIYFPIEHPFYNLKVTQVSCSSYIAALVAREHDKRPEQAESPHLLEIMDVLYRNIGKYLAEKGLSTSELFRAKTYKRDSLIYLLKVIVKVELSEQDIDFFIESKNMRLNGPYLNMKPLFEVVDGIKSNYGHLVVLGSPTSLDCKLKQNGLIVYSFVRLDPKISCRKVACGKEFMIVLSDDLRVYSWGQTKHEALGREFKNETTFVHVDANLAGVEIIDVRCSDEHVLALTLTGYVYAWGRGTNQCLGVGSQDHLREPTQLRLKQISLIRTSNETSCAFGNVLYVWGKQLGGGSSSGVRRKPVEYPLDSAYFSGLGEITRITDIALGRSGQALIDDKHRLWRLPERMQVADSKRFVQVTCHDHVFFAVQDDGSAYSWTSSDRIEAGETVLSRVGDLEEPERIKESAGNFHAVLINEADPGSQKVMNKSRSIKSCRCSEKNTFLVTDVGEVIVAGAGKEGQLGFDPLEEGDEDVDRVHPVQSTFKCIPSLSVTERVSIVDLACGSNHMLAVNSGGRVLAWGSNSFGQLGLAELQAFTMQPTVIEVLMKKKTLKVAAGNSHSLALVEEEGHRVLYAFGSAQNGKLGLGNLLDETIVWQPQPVPFSTEGTLKSISCGANHSMVLDSSRALYMWGEGWKGQLGFGNKECVKTPKLVRNFEWKAAVGCSQYTLGVTYEQKLHYWGKFHHLEALYPTAVPGLDMEVGKLIAGTENLVFAVESRGKRIFSWGQADDSSGFSAHTETLPRGERAVSLSMGKAHGCLVTDEGKVITWGRSADGRLGQPHVTEKYLRYSARELTLPEGLLEKGNEDDEQDAQVDPKFTFQDLLHSEDNLLGEKATKEIDARISSDFDHCLKVAERLEQFEEDNAMFMEKLQFKMLNRLSGKPFNCKFNSAGQSTVVKYDEDFHWLGATLSSYQMHPCYTFRLLKATRNPDFLHIIYKDMEHEKFTICAALYLLQLLVNDEASLKDTIRQEGGAVRTLVVKIIKASYPDMRVMRDLANEAIDNMIGAVDNDFRGIDPDPLDEKMRKKPGANRRAAFHANKGQVTRRASNLAKVFAKNASYMRKNLDPEHQPPLSTVVTTIVKVIINKLEIEENRNIHKLNEDDSDLVHLILDLLFQPLYDVLDKPFQHCLQLPQKKAEYKINISWLRNTYKAFFTGKPLGEKNEQWFAKINEIPNDPANISFKFKLLASTLNSEVDLEVDTLHAIFAKSMEVEPQRVTVKSDKVNSLLTATTDHINKIRVNDPIYDAMVIILKSLKKFKGLPPNKYVNLKLSNQHLRLTRLLKRCPICNMIVINSMAPADALGFIDLYQPISAGSQMDLYTRILENAPRRHEKTKLLLHLEQFKRVQKHYLHDYEKSQWVSTLRTRIRLENIARDVQGKSQNELLEESLKSLDTQCIQAYVARKRHNTYQCRLNDMIADVQRITQEALEDYESFHGKWKKILLNVEYGATNVEMEKYTDAVVYKVFLNKIKEQISKKQVSNDLFATLVEDLQDNLQGYMKKQLSSLKKKKIIESETFTKDRRFPKSSIFANFEIVDSALRMTFFSSRRKFNICGRDEFRKEQILFTKELSEQKILRLRRDSIADHTTTYKAKDSGYEIKFRVTRLLTLVTQIEDSVSAYQQKYILSRREIEHQREADAHQARKEKPRNPADAIEPSSKK